MLNPTTNTYVAAPSAFHAGSDGTLSADASDLGLRPGQFPTRIVMSLRGRLRELYVVGRHTDNEGDLLYIEYGVSFGSDVRVIIFND